jgi:hypothetical protein
VIVDCINPPVPDFNQATFQQTQELHDFCRKYLLDYQQKGIEKYPNIYNGEDIFKVYTELKVVLMWGYRDFDYNLNLVNKMICNSHLDKYPQEIMYQLYNCINSQPSSFDKHNTSTYIDKSFEWGVQSVLDDLWEGEILQEVNKFNLCY